MIDPTLYTTLTEATKSLGYSSRDSVERMIKAGKIRFVTICEGTNSAVRLLLKEDIMKQKVMK